METGKAIVIDTEQDAKTFYLQLFAFLTGETAGTSIGTRVRPGSKRNRPHCMVGKEYDSGEQ